MGPLSPPSLFLPLRRGTERVLEGSGHEASARRSPLAAPDPLEFAKDGFGERWLASPETHDRLLKAKVDLRQLLEKVVLADAAPIRSPLLELLHEIAELADLPGQRGALAR